MRQYLFVRCNDGDFNDVVEDVGQNKLHEYHASDLCRSYLQPLKIVENTH